jgi:YABBY protein
MAKKKHETAASAAPAASAEAVQRRSLTHATVKPSRPARPASSTKPTKAAKSGNATKHGDATRKETMTVLHSSVSAPAPGSHSSVVKQRTLSPYNMFMKTHLGTLKREYPGIVHKDAFVQVATAWATAPENPKNRANQSDHQQPQSTKGSAGVAATEGESMHQETAREAATAPEASSSASVEADRALGTAAHPDISDATEQRDVEPQSAKPLPVRSRAARSGRAVKPPTAGSRKASKKKSRIASVAS